MNKSVAQTLLLNNLFEFFIKIKDNFPFSEFLMELLE
jgi:hypothetical protein